MALSGASPSPQVLVSNSRRSVCASSSSLQALASRTLASKPRVPASLPSFLAKPSVVPLWLPNKTSSGFFAAPGVVGAAPVPVAVSAKDSSPAKYPFSHARCSALKGAEVGTSGTAVLDSELMFVVST